MKKLLLATTLALATSAAFAAEFGGSDIQRAIDTYRANEVRFQRDFAGRSIDFNWVFYKASSRFIGSGYRITIGNGGFSGNVDCIINDQATLDQLVNWNKGQRIHVTGIIDDVTMGDLQLKQCRLEAM